MTFANPIALPGTRKFVDTAFGRIAVQDVGSGPAALFVHGAMLNGDQWRHQLSGLSDVRRVIAPDSLGMGHTEARPDQPLGMNNQAAMLRALLDALQIDRVDLVGNDSGGGAAQVFAANNPGRVRTLALTNCEVDDYDEDAPASARLRAQVESGMLVKILRAASDNPAIGRKALAVAYEDVRALPDELVLGYLRPLVQSEERIRQLLRYFAATTKRDLVAVREQLRKLPAPTLVLWGTSDDFFDVKWARWLEVNLPDVTEVVELAGAKVFWPEERPDFLNAKLRAHWAAHGA